MGSESRSNVALARPRCARARTSSYTAAAPALDFDLVFEPFEVCLPIPARHHGLLGRRPKRQSDPRSRHGADTHRPRTVSAWSLRHPRFSTADWKIQDIDHTKLSAKLGDGRVVVAIDVGGGLNRISRAELAVVERHGAENISAHPKTW